MYAYAFSSCIGEFPWGDYDVYVIWGLAFYPLSIIIAGLGVLLLLINRKNILSALVILLFSLMLYVPMWIGFDNAEDVLGRWIGFLIGGMVLIFLLFKLINSILTLYVSPS